MKRDVSKKEVSGKEASRAWTLFKKRTGQITIFIILGIIILFLVALTLYWRNSFNAVRPPVQQLVVDAELQPLQAYATECLSAVSKDALIRLGQNGGYITIPAGMRVDPVRPYNSDVLLFAPQTIPYWYYSKPCAESSAGCIIINNPPVCNRGVDCAIPYTGSNSMEEQLNTFIETNIAQCINNFEPFKDRFDVKIGTAKADSRITESSVGFKLEYPLTISVKGSSKQAEIAYFYTEHELKLGEIYRFAQDIRDAQANFTFLERNTLNLISVYSGIDSNLLPPMSGMDMFVRGKKYWIRSEVKQKLMNDILPYTMLLQFANSGNAQQIYSKSTNPKYISFEEGFYKSMMLQVSNTTTYFDLNANVYYPPGSEIYFKIGESEIIKPKDLDAGDSIVMKLVGFAMNDYSFKYDLTYPVIVRIEDPEAFNGEGYVFNYAMQANIRQNVPITKNMTVTNVINTPSIEIDDMPQRVNRTITVITSNKYSKEPLTDVIISYKCGGQFVIGTTAMKSGKAILQDRFPYCEFGGEIVYEKAGFMGGSLDYSNIEGTDAKEFRIEMWPLQEKQIKVYKRTDSDINSIRHIGIGGIVLYTTSYTELAANETVFVNLARLKDDLRETDVPLVGFMVVKNEETVLKPITKQDQIDYVNSLFTGGQINESVKDSMINDINFVTDEQAAQAVEQSQEPVQDYVLDFVPGTYVLDAFMMYTGNIHIPAETQTICAAPVMGICITGEQTMTLPEQNFSSWINGGVKTDFTLTEDEVYGNNTLIIYIAEMPLPTSWKALQENPSLEVYQEDKLAFLHPVVK